MTFHSFFKMQQKFWYGEGKRIFFRITHETDTIYQVYLDTDCWRWTLETVFVKWV